VRASERACVHVRVHASTHANTCMHQCKLLDTRMHVSNAALPHARVQRCSRACTPPRRQGGEGETHTHRHEPHHATVTEDRWPTASTEHRCTDALLPLKANTQDKHGSTVARKPRTEDRCNTLAFAVLTGAITAALRAKDTPPFVHAHTRQV
jgi:hypothetical protein